MKKEMKKEMKKGSSIKPFGGFISIVPKVKSAKPIPEREYENINPNQMSMSIADILENK